MNVGFLLVSKKKKLLYDTFNTIQKSVKLFKEWKSNY